MKSLKKLLLFLALSICIISVPSAALNANAASKVKLNRTSATITKGSSIKLKVSGTRKKVSWSSKNSKIAAVSNSGNVSGKKVGQTTIVAKVGSKKLTCTVKVIKQDEDDDNGNSGEDEKSTEQSLTKEEIQKQIQDEVQKQVQDVVQQQVEDKVQKEVQDKVTEQLLSQNNSNFNYADLQWLIQQEIQKQFNNWSQNNNNNNNNQSQTETETETCKHPSTSLANYKEATYTEEGYTGDKYCDVCGELVEEGHATPKRTDYTTVKLTKDNFFTYFKEQIVFSEKYKDDFGDTFIQCLHCFVLKPEYWDKVIPELCKATIEFNLNEDDADITFDCDTLEYTLKYTSENYKNGSPSKLTGNISHESIYINNGKYYLRLYNPDNGDNKKFTLAVELLYDDTYTIQILEGTKTITTPVLITSGVSVNRVGTDSVLCFKP